MEAAVGDREGINESLIQVALNGDYDDKLRLRALQALAVFRLEEANNSCGKWCTTACWQVRSSGRLSQLSELDSRRSLARDLSLLRKEDPYFAEGAIRGLGYIRDPRVLPILQNHVHQEQDLNLRILVEESIERVQRAERKQEQNNSTVSLKWEPEGMP